MINAANVYESLNTTELAAIERFSRSLSAIGPHSIPKTRQVKNEYHKFHAPKAGHQLVECESGLESLAMFWGESRPEITAIMAQPLRIYGAIGKRPYHTLDVAFTFCDGRTIYYEVKPEKHLKVHADGSVAPANWPYITAWAEANGFEVGFITEKTLWVHRQQIENWRTLLPFAAESYLNPDPELESALYHLIRNGDAWCIAQLEERHPNIEPEVITGHVAKLLHKGDVTAYLQSEPVSPSTQLNVEEVNDEAA